MKKSVVECNRLSFTRVKTRLGFYDVFCSFLMVFVCKKLTVQEKGKKQNQAVFKKRIVLLAVNEANPPNKNIMLKVILDFLLKNTLIKSN